MFIAGFPAGPWGTNCYVVATGPGTECVVVDPGKDAADGRRRRWCASTASSRSRCWSPTATSTTCGASPRSPAPTTRPPGSTRATGTCSPTRWPGMSPETAAMLLGGNYEFVEPDDVRELADAPDARAGRAGVRGRPHARPHRGLGHVPDAVRRPAAGHLRGDVLRRPALRRLDRPHRPARRRPPDDAAQPGHQGAAAGRRRRRCSPDTASRRRSGASARPTRSCSTCRAPAASTSPEDC